MQVFQVSNYKTFASSLEARTGCDIRIKIMGRDHTHYELSKMGVSLGILCVDKGIASFAPFVTHETAKNEQYINLEYFPMLEDFSKVLQVLSGIFTYDQKLESSKSESDPFDIHDVADLDGHDDY